MVVPTFMHPVLATPVCALIHDPFLCMVNSVHASSLTVSTPSTLASTLSLTMPRLCHHLRSRRIFALPLLGASLCPRLLSDFLNIDNLDFGIVDLGYLKHSFLDHGYDYLPLLLATSTPAQRATALLKHSSHNVCAAPVVTAGGC
jgi:hypothetical protein